MMRNTVTLFWTFFLLGFAMQAHATTPLPEDNSNAVILAYHRIGEDAMPDSSLRKEQFEEHLNEIRYGEYNVMPLPALLNTIQNKQPLPSKTIAITFEGAFRSAYENAMLPLLEKDIPFTIFFSSGQTDHPNHLNWKTLQALAKEKTVTLGILPENYDHISSLPIAEQRMQINQARGDFRKHTGHEAQYFSYPFGEISNELKTIINEQGFKAAFGLQSGTVHPSSDFTALPRFTMTDAYGDLERFKLVTQSLPLPVKDIEPENWLLTTQTPAIGFTLPDTLTDDAENISCFISEYSEKPTLETLGSRVELRLKETLDGERIRVNCTLSGPDAENGSPRWRWLGLLLHRASKNPQPGEPL